MAKIWTLRLKAFKIKASQAIKSGYFFCWRAFLLNYLSNSDDNRSCQLVKKYIFFLAFTSFLISWITGWSQGWNNLPQLKPAYSNDFFREDLSYSGSCFNNVVLDDSGRMWLNACGLQRAINSLGVFSFDGYRFLPMEIEKADGKAITLDVMGMTSDGKLYGQANKKAFLMNPHNPVAEILPFADTLFNQSILRGIKEVDGTLYVMANLEPENLRLFSLQDGKLQEVLVIDYSDGFWTAAIHNISGDAEELWLVGGNLPVFRVDQLNNRVDTFTTDDFTEPVPTSELTRNNIFSKSPRIVKTENDQTYLFLPQYYGSQLYRFDRAAQKFTSLNSELPPGWVPLGFFQDQVGNICFLFEDINKQYKAILEDQNGRRYDYSEVVAPHEQITNMLAKDFRNHTYIVGEDGLHSTSIRQSGAIEQALQDIWISSMIHLSKDQLLVNTVLNGWFLYDGLRGEVRPFVGPDCNIERPAFGKGMKQQIIPDQKGNLWFTSNNYLVKYNRNDHTCSTIELKNNGQLFALVQSDLAIVQDSRTEVSLVDINVGKTIPLENWMPEDLGSFLRDILVDTKGVVWIPTNKGLWKLDFDKEQARHIITQEGFSDYRFASIYEDRQGKLWLGTYFGGLHIYDPETEDVVIVDQTNGLSNNSVMSIIADDEGDIWVGTEYGITILSPSGEVLNTIFQEDGLNIDKFERFDPYKGPDGKLYFGSRNGLNIIDPQQLKTNFKDGANRKIYLTEAVFYDKEVGKELVHRDNLEQLGTLQIPAENPGILLKFALSCYLEPQKNRYAYKLEGIDQDWTYLGTQPELKISRLPPGKYNILIRGADFRNNWTTDDLVVAIHAKQFFYRQVWFYLVAALPFLFFIYAWIRNKQQEARRLELKVAIQTQKIRQDKELIEQQADELRQLDELKSNFFTNISHELRTPITLIKAPLENIVEKYGTQLEKTLSNSIQLVLNNAGKLSRLVEELLELSQLDAKRMTLKEQSTPFSVFCEQLFYAYAAAAALKKIEYHFQSKIGERQHFMVDRNRLEKVINNLLSNALKFTPEAGKVDMEIYQEGTQLLIKVQDSGRGIPEEDQPYLFERYFQTRRKDISTEGGTGIGLSLSKELVTLMGGQISVESEWGKGTTFWVRLPAKAAAASKKEAASAEKEFSFDINAPVVPLAEAATSGKREGSKILVVEDNPEMQVLIQSILSVDYNCVIANHGLEAWTLLQKEDSSIDDIDLILSDVMMPEMDGYTLLEKIKGHDRWRNLPVVMLTARSAEEDKLQALRMGVDDYLMKPFSPQELKARLHNLISNYQNRKQFQQNNKAESAKIDIEFETEESASQIWLKEVETAAKEALDKGYKLTTSVLADQVFLSERQFSRRLKSMTGLTPNGYIQEVKLQKARTLLENGVYTTVGEVAAAAGYSSGSYLTKSYQDRFGKKPGAYL